jgi:hypothetical protein
MTLAECRTQRGIHVSVGLRPVRAFPRSDALRARPPAFDD